MKLISWNLLHRNGADVAEVADLIAAQRPDLFLMQEATASFADLVNRIGGAFSRVALPGRVHGLAMWMPHATAAPPVAHPLPAGALVLRVCQIVDLGPFAVANVHLSHGQVLNRRQMRSIALHLPHAAVVIGDTNMVGPTLLPGFHDVGPRELTHRMSRMLPLRLDRCLVRGLACTEAAVLPRGKSDHHPIMLRLEPVLKIRQ